MGAGYLTPAARVLNDVVDARDAAVATAFRDMQGTIRRIVSAIGDTAGLPVHRGVK